MNNSSTSKQLLTATALIFMGAFSRLIPHPVNFTAIGAISLLSGAVITDRRLMFAVPFGAMILSDLIIGFHDIMLPVYSSMAIITLLGMFMGRTPRPMKLISYTLSGSLVFFLVTNLPVWYHGYYTNDLNGLIQSYTAALPFFKNQLAGDLFFSFSLFAVYSVLKNKVVEKAY